MRKYETIFIINPDLSEEDSKGVIEKVRGLVEDLQGEVLKIEEWGKKRLARGLESKRGEVNLPSRLRGGAEIACSPLPSTHGVGRTIWLPS